ncbi:MAG TPA: threonine ammonia-lyase [Rubrivivax sp.]|jgi:threonine dehydratase|nr:threonine ammonia-lyase [Rubrivivax sp.]
MSSPDSVTLDDVKAARAAIKDLVVFTPCQPSVKLSALTHTKLFLKMENMQRTGAYKDRGAMNAVVSLDDKARQAGVIAASAGNHAQGLAYAAQCNNVKCTIVMPETAPIAKVAGTEKYGATVVLHGSGFDDALARANEIQKETGATFVHAFDHPKVIAGQGVVALELLEQNPFLEVFVVPIGGGGLIAGMGVVLKSINPSLRIVGVQSEKVPSMKVSIEKGEITTVPGATIADGIAVARPGSYTFPLIQKYVDEIVTVSEDEIAHAVLLLAESEKTIVEGSGGAGLAAVVNGKIKGIEGKQVCVVLTGGNIDTSFLAKLLAQGMAKDGRLAKFSVIVPDRAGSFVDLSQIAAEHKANVIDIHQSRTFTSAAHRDKEIELLVEVRGPEVAAKMLEAIKAKGYEVTQHAAA